MRNVEVQVGEYYIANVSGKRSVIYLDSESKYGGYNATNMTTNRQIHIASGRRLQKFIPRDKVNQLIAIYGK